MESKPKEQVAPAPLHNRHRPLRIMIALAVVLIFAIVVGLVTDRTSDKVTWLNPSDMSPSKQYSRFTILKDATKQVLAHFWHRSKKTQLLIESNILQFYPGVPEQLKLGAPISVSDNGAKAWVLTEDAVKDLRQQLKGNSGMFLQAIESSLRMSTADGIRSTHSMGTQVAINGKPIIAGTIVDILPKIVSHTINLRIGVTSSALISPTNESPLVKTNFSVTCRTTLPNAGALLVNSGAPPNAEGKIYWFLVSSTMINPDGTRLKP